MQFIKYIKNIIIFKMNIMFPFFIMYKHLPN